jgi:hypothetical protein
MSPSLHLASPRFADESGGENNSLLTETVGGLIIN